MAPPLRAPVVAAGDRYGRLTVVEYAYSKRGRYYRCRCDCGNETVASAGGLRSGHPRSCGCLQREAAKVSAVKHGHRPQSGASPTYSSWKAMTKRCTNTNHHAWVRYGGRGIKVHPAWQGPDGFSNFLTDMGERPAGKTLDRFPNPDGNYEPTNCRWATWHEQRINRGGKSGARSERTSAGT